MALLTMLNDVSAPGLSAPLDLGGVYQHFSTSVRVDGAVLPDLVVVHFLQSLDGVDFFQTGEFLATQSGGMTVLLLQMARYLQVELVSIIGGESVVVTVKMQTL